MCKFVIVTVLDAFAVPYSTVISKVCDAVVSIVDVAVLTIGQFASVNTLAESLYPIFPAGSFCPASDCRPNFMYVSRSGEMSDSRRASKPKLLAGSSPAT